MVTKKDVPSFPYEVGSICPEICIFELTILPVFPFRNN